MFTELNPIESNAINCNECGKINKHGKIGTHWICGDCKVDGPQLEEEMDIDY